MIRFAYLLLPLLLGLSTPEKINYDVRYILGDLNTRVITVEITWEESEWNEIPAYHSEAVLKTRPFFRLFLSPYYYAETYFNQDERKPLFFANPFKYKGKKATYEYVYREQEIESKSDLGSGPAIYTSFPNDNQTVDFLSLVFFIRFLDLEAAREPLPLHILISGKSFPAELQYLGQDPDKYLDTPADKFLLRMTERGLMENGSGHEVYIWRSISDNPVILGLETELSAGFMSVKMTNFAE